MTRLEALKELAKKVEAGSAFGCDYGCILDDWPKDSGVRMDADSAYHGSLDAALALHEAVLPGCQFHIATEANGEGFVAEIFDCKRDRFIAHACTDRPARAWLLAILRALIAQEESA
jgi:hypothetical protein